jgi:deoxyribose-phosphate aldolase
MAIPDVQKETKQAAPVERNPGIPLDMGWVRSTRANLSATERRAATIGTRRTVKKDWQARGARHYPLT